MEQERITFGKFTLPVIPKSNLSFRIHKDIEGVDRSQKFMLDNHWNAKSDIKKLTVLNALSFHFLIRNHVALMNSIYFQF